MLSRTRRVLLSGLLVAGGLGVGPAGAATAAPPVGPGAGPQYKVTLLTGDVVTVNPALPGCAGVRISQPR